MSAEEMFGPYRLEGLIGRGGMGEVYRAYDTRTERIVALKRLPAHLAAEPEFLSRFRRECQLAARLSEPHVIPVHGYGEIDGRLYIDMRLVEGVSLTDLIRERQLPPARAVNIVTQIAGALDAAHRAGLVHRDIKPSNVLLADATQDEDFAYLIDFGVARTLDDAGTMTSPGMVIGTPTYLAPEVFTGDPTDSRVDIYALACMFYECLTGRRPFAGDGVPTLIYAHLNQDPPRPSEQGLPHGFDEIIARGMAKDPEDRYPTAGALATAARSVLTGSIDIRSGAAAVRAPAPQPLSPIADPPTVIIPSAGHPDAPPATRPSRTDTPGPAENPFRAPTPMRLGLDRQLTFDQGPLPHDSPLPFLDNQPAVDELRRRIRHSAGGATLVTGFNGVGKTTVVARALTELGQNLASTEAEPIPLVEVWLGVAGPLSPNELLVKLIRNLHESLHEAGVLDRLDVQMRQTLELAYTRTSQAIKEARSDGTERSAEFGLPANLLGIELPALTASRTRSRSTSRETEFQAYSLADAEHDFLRITKRLCGRAAHAAPRQRPSFLQRLRGAGPGPWLGRLVIVIDELDKLTADPGGADCLERLLTILKNVFTAGDVYFVFVAGTDVLDRARDAYGRGKGVWSDVFGAQPPYIPCLSVGAARILVSTLAIEGRPPLDMGDLCEYLTYRSRGIPRLLLAALDTLVVWPDGDEPAVMIGERRAISVAFYAGLQRKLAAFVERPMVDGPFTEPVDIDRRRIGAYLMTDWALRRGNATFSVADFVADDTAARPHADIVSDRLAGELLEALASGRVGVLERWDPAAAGRTMLDVAQSSEAVYRLAPAILAAASGTGEVAAELGRVGGGRYLLLEELGRGALGRTYRAFDERAGYAVAAKLLDIPGLVTDDVARQRFQREAALARRLSHPVLVRILDTLREPDGVLGIVMDYVEGESLEQVIARSRIGAFRAVSIVVDLLDLLTYLMGQGVARLDLKPSNIVLRHGRRPVVTEFGLARRLGDSHSERLTAVGTVMGTPRYAAPEQLRGETVDIRADLYSVGLLLVEMLTGRPARQGRAVTVIRAALDERIDTSALPCSPELRVVVGRLLEPDRARRFATPMDARSALLATAEATGGTVQFPLP